MLHISLIPPSFPQQVVDIIGEEADESLLDANSFTSHHSSSPLTSLLPMAHCEYLHLLILSIIKGHLGDINKSFIQRWPFFSCYIYIPCKRVGQSHVELWGRLYEFLCALFYD